MQSKFFKQNKKQMTIKIENASLKRGDFFEYKGEKFLYACGIWGNGYFEKIVAQSLTDRRNLEIKSSEEITLISKNEDFCK